MLVTDDRLGGPVDIGYPCGAYWCLSVPDTSELLLPLCARSKTLRWRAFALPNVAQIWAREAFSLIDFVSAQTLEVTKRIWLQCKRDGHGRL